MRGVGFIRYMRFRGSGDAAPLELLFGLILPAVPIHEATANHRRSISGNIQAWYLSKKEGEFLQAVEIVTCQAGSRQYTENFFCCLQIPTD
jgi:hypothetical protein